MKKKFTIDAFVVAFLAAIGYGFGFSVPFTFDLPIPVCLIICIVVGVPIEIIGEKIIFSKFTQEKKYRKYLVCAGFIAFYLLADLVSEVVFDESLFDSLETEVWYVIIICFIGFISSLIIHYYRMVKVKRKYGAGEEGFYFNPKEKKRIEKLNKKNQEIIGKYDNSLAVETRTGIYVGKKDNGVISFYGIPYAKAPVGELRWKAPEPLDDSEKVFEAKYYGPSAIQVNYEGNPLKAHNQSEDCLYINIHTSKISPKGKKPVIVYFHGGDFTYGGSANPIWETHNFVKEEPGIVTVSFNYRLGILGYINFSEIEGGENYPDSCNLGILDQIAALEWIKDNIALFGGDPEQITVMGDGAGGISIGFLSTCERAKGLFQNAVILSGNLLLIEPDERKAKMLASKLLEESKLTSMDDLLKLDESKLSDLTQKLSGYLTTPQKDGRLFNSNILEAYKNGMINDVKMILCTSEDNSNVYSASVGRGSYEIFINETIQRFLYSQKPEVAEKLKKLLDDETKRVGKLKAEIRFANTLFEQGGTVILAKSLCEAKHCPNVLFWETDPVIKALGTGDFSISCTILGNNDAAISYGSIINEDIQKILRKLILKFMHGEELKLYKNEIEGAKKIVWNAYPDVLVVKEKEVTEVSSEEAFADAIDVMKKVGLI